MEAGKDNLAKRKEYVVFEKIPDNRDSPAGSAGRVK